MMMQSTSSPLIGTSGRTNNDVGLFFDLRCHFFSRQRTSKNTIAY